MSIIIKDMVMPSSCRLCGFNDYCYCTIRGLYVDGTATHGRADFCPLAELPEKHGRLVDADAYVSMMEEKCDYEKALDPYVLSVCRGGIKLMPTIVEAERE